MVITVRRAIRAAAAHGLRLATVVEPAAGRVARRAMVAAVVDIRPAVQVAVVDVHPVVAAAAVDIRLAVIAKARSDGCVIVKAIQTGQDRQLDVTK